MNEWTSWMNFSPALDLTCFVQWRSSLPLTSRPYIRRLFLFFSPPISLFISVLQYCSDLAFVFGFSVKFGPTCLPIFCSHRPLVELLMLRKPTKSSCFLEDIRVPFDCKQQISKSHVIVFKKASIQSYSLDEKMDSLVYMKGANMW